ncbi:MEMO1 family protein [Candidatus Micrarchaeota archaeon]|nr:MEMO1 family protein [Candidatus Micrarchaeota archaeon]
MRQPAVAGTFYPFDREDLLRMIDRMIDRATVRQYPTFGFVSPHAGYIYSGWTAAYGYKSAVNIEDVETVILIGPNHTGMGWPVAVSSDTWVTPLGKLDPDTAFIKEIVDDTIRIDETAHRYEHSIEVQLPFLQRFNPDVRIVPIVMMDQTMPIALHLAERIVNTVGKEHDRYMVIASSDLSHYVPGPVEKEKDTKFLEKITSLDIEGMYQTLRRENVSACGYGPIAVLMKYAKVYGCGKGIVLHHSNSGDVTGDYSSVVGYASVTMPKEG